jgi:DNA-directed RNA polymerase specialized sigma24 family protein
MTPRNTSGADSDPREDDTLRDVGGGRFALPPDPPSSDASTSLQCEHASFTDAMLQILRRYTAEVRAFLRARTNSRASMDEVFAVFSEDVWRGLPRLRVQGQLRSWIYVIARNALTRHVRFKQRWRSRYVFAEPDDLHVETRRSLSTQLGNHAQLELVLAALAESDRRLLEQRLVLSMPWRDIAIEQARLRGLTSDADIAKESARLRKRFQLLLQDLRERAAKSRDSRFG